MQTKGWINISVKHLSLMSFNTWKIYVKSLQRQEKMSIASALLRLSLFAVTVTELASSQQHNSSCAEYEQSLSQLQADMDELMIRTTPVYRREVKGKKNPNVKLELNSLN